MIISKPSKESGIATNFSLEPTAQASPKDASTAFLTSKKNEYLPFGNLKNPTPARIVLVSSLVISIFCTAFLSLLNLVQHANFSWLMLVLMGLVTFGTCYAVFRYYLLRYVQRKVKVIYKSIHKHKLATNEKKGWGNMQTNVMEDVESEVEAWLASRIAEREAA